MQRFLESLNGVEIWFRMLHNCEWECWLDSCQSLTSTKRMIGHKRSFLKKLAALRLLHPSWWRGSWMEGNNWAEKRCTTYRENCNLERIVRESPFKNMGGNSWGMDCSESSREPLHTDASRTLTGAVLVSSHSWTRDILPGQKTNRVLPVLPLSGPNEIMYFIWKIIVPESGRESQLLELQSKVSTVIVVLVPCHLLVLVCHCDLSGQKSAQHLTGDFRTLHAFFFQSTFGRWRFNFPAGFGTCSPRQKHQSLV